MSWCRGQPRYVLVQGRGSGPRGVHTVVRLPGPPEPAPLYPSQPACTARRTSASAWLTLIRPPPPATLRRRILTSLLSKSRDCLNLGASPTQVTFPRLCGAASARASHPARPLPPRHAAAAAAGGGDGGSGGAARARGAGRQLRLWAWPGGGDPCGDPCADAVKTDAVRTHVDRTHVDRTDVDRRNVVRTVSIGDPCGDPCEDTRTQGREERQSRVCRDAGTGQGRAGQRTRRMKILESSPTIQQS
jgi:hypothetical protein